MDARRHPVLTAPIAQQPAPYFTDPFPTGGEAGRKTRLNGLGSNAMATRTIEEMANRVAAAAACTGGCRSRANVAKQLQVAPQEASQAIEWLEMEHYIIRDPNQFDALEYSPEIHRFAAPGDTSSLAKISWNASSSAGGSAL